MPTVKLHRVHSRGRSETPSLEIGLQEFDPGIADQLGAPITFTENPYNPLPPPRLGQQEQIVKPKRVDTPDERQPSVNRGKEKDGPLGYVKSKVGPICDWLTRPRK